MPGDEGKPNPAQPVTNAAGAPVSMAWTNDPRPLERFPVLDLEHALQYGNALFETKATRAEEFTEYQWGNLCLHKIATFPAHSKSDPPSLCDLRKRVEKLLRNPKNDGETWASILLARKVGADEPLPEEERTRLAFARQMEDPLARKARREALSKRLKESTVAGQFELLLNEAAEREQRKSLPGPTLKVRNKTTQKVRTSKQYEVAMALKLLIGNPRLTVKEIARFVNVDPSTLHRDAEFQKVNAARRKANQKGPKVKYTDRTEPKEDDERKED
jgi:hypothetical protein